MDKVLKTCTWMQLIRDGVDVMEYQANCRNNPYSVERYAGEHQVYCYVCSKPIKFINEEDEGWVDPIAKVIEKEKSWNPALFGDFIDRVYGYTGEVLVDGQKTFPPIRDGREYNG